MRLAAVLLVVIGCPSFAFGQGRLDVRWEKNAIVRLSQGRDVNRIDLSQEISGCTSEVYDRTTGRRFGHGLRKTQVLDVTGRDGQHFVLLSAVAAPNCNVQGRCGAGDDEVTLIWLHVGADLVLVRKQAFEVEDCEYPRTVEGQPDDWKSNLKLTAGSLKLSFNERTYSSDKPQEFSGQVIYNRQSASEGIQITRVPK
jgi:hypothetical protein